MLNFIKKKGWVPRILKGTCSSKTASSPNHFDFISPSFPKTGNTWVRYLLGQYFMRIYQLESLPLFDSGESFTYPGPKGHFTHGVLTWETQSAADLCFKNAVLPFLEQKVILLIRHPLDILVSHYMHALRINSYQLELIDFINDPVWGGKKLEKYFSLWAPTLSRENVFPLYYEALREDTYSNLRQLIAFLELPWNDKFALESIADASFSSMQKLEKSGNQIQYQSSGESIFGCEQDPANPERYHVRKGKVFGYKDYLSDDQLLQAKATVKTMCNQYGYKI